MTRRQRLDVEDIQPGVPDMAGLPGVNHRLLVDQRGACRVDEDDTRPQCRDALAREKTAGFVVQQQMQRDHVAWDEACIQLDEADAVKTLRRPVPGGQEHYA